MTTDAEREAQIPMDDEIGRAIAGLIGAQRRLLNAALAEAARYRDECNEAYAKFHKAKEEIVALKAAERSLSDAYVRLRAMIPGAFDTPHAPSPEQVWETTETALAALKAQLSFDKRKEHG